MNFQILSFMMLCVIVTVRGQFSNCNGKPFLCRNSTTFTDCVGIDGGLFVTIDNSTSTCIAGLVCVQTNTLPCEAPAVTTTPAGPVNCNNKTFICVDSTNFIQCVDIGGGVLATISNTVESCIAGTVCNVNNSAQCEDPAVTTTTAPTTTRTTTAAPSSASSSLASTVSVVSNVTSVSNVSTVSNSSTVSNVSTVSNSSSVSTASTTPASLTPVTSSSLECPRTGLFGDPNDCHKYYSCSGNVRLTYYCPFGTVFSTFTRTCTVSTNECGTFFFNCVINGSFPDPKNCYRFFKCRRNGNIFSVSSLTCGDGQSYYGGLGKCKTGKTGCGGKIPGLSG